MGSNDGSRTWEVAWSTEDMRSKSSSWTLAGDSGLLHHLEGFSKQLLEKTQKIEQEVDVLVSESKDMSSHVNTLNSRFQSLSNTQFVESRVYDDEEREMPQEEKPSEKDKGEPDMLPVIKQSLQMGLGVITEEFETIYVEDSEDSEDDEDGVVRPQPVLESKDPYLTRPLPFLIGSKSFLEDDNVGLIDEETESESGGEDDERHIIEKELESETSSSASTGQFSNHRVRRGSDNSSVTDALFGGQSNKIHEDKISDMFTNNLRKDIEKSDNLFGPGDESDEDDFIFGGKSSIFGKGPNLFDNLGNRENDRLFDKSEPVSSRNHNDSDAGKLHPAADNKAEYVSRDSSQKTVRSGGLFDSDGNDDDGEDSLFGPQLSKSRISSQAQNRLEDKKEEGNPSQSTKKKVPTGGVSLFGPTSTNPILEAIHAQHSPLDNKESGNPDEWVEPEKIPPRSESRSSLASRSTKTESRRTSASSSSTGLFADEPVIGDSLFSPDDNKRKKSNMTGVSLFSDDADDDDFLFGTSEKVLPQKSKIEIVSDSPQTNRDTRRDFTNTTVAQKSGHATGAIPKQTPRTKQVSLFDEENDSGDELFSSASSTSSKSSKTKSNQNSGSKNIDSKVVHSRKIKGLFDDDDEFLFGSTVHQSPTTSKSTNNPGKTLAPPKTLNIKKVIPDNDVDKLKHDKSDICKHNVNLASDTDNIDTGSSDLHHSNPKTIRNPIPDESVKHRTDNIFKADPKNSIFDDLFSTAAAESDDLFSSGTHSSIQTKHSNDSRKHFPKKSPVEKNRKILDTMYEDDIFAEPARSKLQQENTNIVKSDTSKLAHKEVLFKNQTSSLFDSPDDEDLFSDVLLKNDQKSEESGSLFKEVSVSQKPFVVEGEGATVRTAHSVIHDSNIKSPGKLSHKPVGGVPLFGGVALFVGSTLQSEKTSVPETDGKQVDSNKEERSTLCQVSMSQSNTTSMSQSNTALMSQSNTASVVKSQMNFGQTNSKDPAGKPPGEVSQRPIGGVALFGGVDIFGTSITSPSHDGEVPVTKEPCKLHGTSSSDNSPTSPVSFDSPATIDTLSSIAKERVKVSVKRRPPSRKGRKEALRTSGIFPDEKSTVGEPVTASTSVQPQEPPHRDIFSAGVTNKKDNTVTLSADFDDFSPESENLFGGLSKSPVRTKKHVAQKSPSPSRIKPKLSPKNTLFSDDLEDDDLFSLSANNNLKATWPSPEVPSKHLDFSHEEQPANGELFGDHSPRMSRTELQARSLPPYGDKSVSEGNGRESSSVKPLDPVESTSAMSTHNSQTLTKSQIVAPKVKSSRGLFSDDTDENEDLFGSTTKETSVSPPPAGKSPDVHLSKKQSTTKSSKSVGKSVFDDDLDDIFSINSSASRMTSKPKKPLLTAATKSGDIFDDPLMGSNH